MAKAYRRSMVAWEDLQMHNGIDVLCTDIITDLETWCFELTDENKDQLKSVVRTIATEIQKILETGKIVRLSVLPAIMKQYNIHLGKR
jgi:hypothetical protein